jgi:hypothetical protein
MDWRRQVPRASSQPPENGRRRHFQPGRQFFKSKIYRGQSNLLLSHVIECLDRSLVIAFIRNSHLTVCVAWLAASPWENLSKQYESRRLLGICFIPLAHTCDYYRAFQPCFALCTFL